jgi:hypothetical protein
MNAVRNLIYKTLHAGERRSYVRAFGEAAAEKSFDTFMLMLIAKSGNGPYLTYLLEKKNPTQEWKDEALATAVQHRQDEMATILLDKGANPMAGDGVLLRKAESAFGRQSTIVAILRARVPKSEIEAFDQGTATAANPAHEMRPV